MQDAGEKKITLAMVADAMKLSGLDYTEDELKAMVDSANQNLARFEELARCTSPTTCRRRSTSARSCPGSRSTKRSCRSASARRRP
jgi:hypothetical protein